MPGPADSWYHEKESAWLYGVVAAGVTVVALFGPGVALSLFTGHSALRGGLRLMCIGGGAGLAAWAVGRLLGASVG